MALCEMQGESFIAEGGWSQITLVRLCPPVRHFVRTDLRLVGAVRCSLVIKCPQGIWTLVAQNVVCIPLAHSLSPLQQGGRGVPVFRGLSAALRVGGADRGTSLSAAGVGADQDVMPPGASFALRPALKDCAEPARAVVKAHDVRTVVAALRSAAGMRGRHA